LPGTTAVGAALVGLVVFAVRLADAGSGFGLPLMVHLTPLCADLPLKTFQIRTSRLG
jgi:hypothetical protein